MFTAAQLEEEIQGSRQEIDKISESVDIYRYDKPADWMKPYTTQAVYRILFKAPPRPLYDISDQTLPEADRQKQKEIDSAPKLLHVAMCLPAGYALIEHPPSSSSASSSSNPPSSFTFPNPLVIEESMHMLLVKVSPIYLAWFEIQMEDKLLALAARPDDDDDD